MNGHVTQLATFNCWESQLPVPSRQPRAPSQQQRAILHSSLDPMISGHRHYILPPGRCSMHALATTAIPSHPYSRAPLVKRCRVPALAPAAAAATTFKWTPRRCRCCLLPPLAAITIASRLLVLRLRPGSCAGPCSGPGSGACSGA